MKGYCGDDCDGTCSVCLLVRYRDEDLMSWMYD